MEITPPGDTEGIRLAESGVWLRKRVPFVYYVDGELNAIAATPSNHELYKLKARSQIIFGFKYFGSHDSKVTIYDNNRGSQVPFDKIMNVEGNHSAWRLSSDKKTVTLIEGRENFVGTILTKKTLDANGMTGKEFYFKVEYNAYGPTVYEGKATRFTF